MMQEHVLKFEKSHKVISVQAYEAHQEYFDQRVCEIHGKELIHACRHCDKLICGECDNETEECMGMSNCM